MYFWLKKTIFLAKSFILHSFFSLYLGPLGTCQNLSKESTLEYFSISQNKFMKDNFRCFEAVFRFQRIAKNTICVAFDIKEVEKKKKYFSI